MVRRWPATGRVIGFLRRPVARLVRIPLGIVLVLGGILSFLPVLGVWMLPLGLLLLAIDLPFLQPPVTWSIVRGRRRWQNWSRTRRARRLAEAAAREARADATKADPRP
nr:hypothetical protein [Arsenicitalea aurantiaca]